MVRMLDAGCSMLDDQSEASSIQHPASSIQPYAARFCGFQLSQPFAVRLAELAVAVDDRRRRRRHRSRSRSGRLPSTQRLESRWRFRRVCDGSRGTNAAGSSRPLPPWSVMPRVSLLDPSHCSSAFEPALGFDGPLDEPGSDPVRRAPRTGRTTRRRRTAASGRAARRRR